MKTIWCWRCRKEIPMLEADEARAVFVNDMNAMPDIGDAEEGRSGPAQSPKHLWHQRMLDRYNILTGFCETNINTAWHHRLSLYGPPCTKCGKPYRTPQASFCAGCGHKQAASPRYQATF